MDILAARSFRVLLAVTLAANCCVPCYTFAYADESQEVAYVPQEEQKEVSGDANGFEFSPGSGERVPYGSDGGSAAEGHGGDLEASESSGQDTSSDNGGLEGAVVYESEPSADYPLVEEGDGGIDESFSGFGGDDSASLDYGISPQAVIGGSIVDALIVSSISGDFVDFSYGSAKWKTNRGTLFWLLSYLLVNMQNTLLRIENYSKAIDTSGKNTASDMSAAAGRISGLLDRGNVTNERLLSIVNNTGDAAGRISGLLDRGNTTNAHLADIVDNTYNTAGRISGLLDRGNVSNESLLSIVNNTGDAAGRISGLLDRGNVTNERLLSLYTLLDAITKGPEGGRVSLYNIGNSIETIKNEFRDLDNLLESVSDRLSALDALGVRLANIALTVDDIRKGVDSSVQWSEVLHGDLSLLRHGVADLLPGYADWTIWDFLQGIHFELGNAVDLLKGLQQTLTAWANRWDLQDQYLMEWAKRWDALDKSPADLSETNKLLGLLTADVASIRDKYVVGDSLSDMFGALVGDLQVPATAAAIDGIKGVMSTAFPFCIPSVVNLVLFGSVVADPQPPVWEFDIAGSPLVVDFASYEDFAEVCRWTVRLLFVAALLLNTRKFVYGVGGAD